MPTPVSTSGPGRLIAVACLAVVLNMTGFLSVAAVLPDLFDAFSLSETDAGWLTGCAFASYAATVPIFTALTDRIDARPLVIAALGITGLAGIGFALFASGFWSAFAFRVLAGIGFAGMHFPGLKMLTDRLPADQAVRGSGIYVSMFSLGGAGSFLLAALVISYLPWPWVFSASGLCSLLGAALIWQCMAAQPPAARQREHRAIREVVRNLRAMRYIVSYFGHVWEMFAFRNWCVVLLGVSASLPQNAAYRDWNLPLLAALTSIAAWPASLVASELALRFSRARVITGTVLISFAVALALAAMGDVPTPFIFAMMLLYSMTAFGDSGPLAAGLIDSVESHARGAALALYALLGFVGGALGPAMVGMVLEMAGGRHDPTAWMTAWLTIGAGTLIVMLAINFRRHR